MHCNAKFYYIGKIPCTGGFKMVLFTVSRGNNFVGVSRLGSSPFSDTHTFTHNKQLM